MSVDSYFLFALVLLYWALWLAKFMLFSQPIIIGSQIKTNLVLVTHISHAWHLPHVFALNSDWFIRFWLVRVINFGFGFTTFNRKSLFHTPRKSFKKCQVVQCSSANSKCLTCDQTLFYCSILVSLYLLRIQKKRQIWKYQNVNFHTVHNILFVFAL